MRTVIVVFTVWLAVNPVTKPLGVRLLENYEPSLFECFARGILRGNLLVGKKIVHINQVLYRLLNSFFTGLSVVTKTVRVPSPEFNSTLPSPRLVVTGVQIDE